MSHNPANTDCAKQKKSRRHVVATGYFIEADELEAQRDIDFGRFAGASSRFGHLRAPQIGVLRNSVSVHGKPQSPLVTRESAGWLESGRRESNPRSQLGKVCD